MSEQCPRPPQMRKAPRTSSIPIRLSEPEISLLEKAAELLGENRSEFVRNAAKEKAMEIVRSSKLKLIAGGLGPQVAAE